MTAVPPHPAKFSPEVADAISSALLAEYHRIAPSAVWVLDPFAGVGGIHKIADRCNLGRNPEDPRVHSVGIEIEPEWAAADPRTHVGDALHLPFHDDTFDAIATSPCYGNRMADHHEAKDGSKRITYRHQLGRALTEGSAGAMQWGQSYRRFHRAAWVEACRVLKPGGIFVVNTSNHVRKGVVQHVNEWHLRTLICRGLTIEAVEAVETRRMGFGANGQTRVPFEIVATFRKPYHHKGD